ncbi:MAG: peptidoglycan DD-metalloendopeptidase family protein [Patescibacteria group bacterium]|nr:peptidoglycan DD-metalloendopeptidase family protein [Patescibacteria group bacterium]
MFRYARRIAAVFLFFLFAGVSIVLISALHTQAQTAPSAIQSQIDQTNAQIKQLQADIAKLQTELNATTAQKQTLQNAINALTLNIQKLQKSIALTQTQITQKDDQIGMLATNISTTSDEITQMEGNVADSLRELDALDYESPVIALLTGGTLSSFFDQSASLDTVRTSLENKIIELSSLKTDLQSSKTAAQQKRDELAALQQNLNDQKQGLAISRDSQTTLLAQTKNQESAYQAQIAQKKAQEAQFESDLENFESKLNLKFSAGSLPPSGPGTLQWPLANIRITQYFGNTDFATQNPQIYSGHGHSGVDLAASPGTPVMAVREGVVLGTGNTDLTCSGASFGKWVFIKHDNGLSTLYAHLATILVSQGQTVTTGQLIAYSDTTGYATGPHLHFGVYASAGSEIASFPSSSCKGKVYTMPVGDLSAYLNPLSYLPPVPGR